MTRTRIFERVVLAAVLTGCSTQVIGDSQGEPLATIRGKVISTQSHLDADSSVSAAILWIYFTFEADARRVNRRLAGQRVAVRSSFPASFTLDVYTAPPPSAELIGPIMQDPGDGTFAAGSKIGVWFGALVALDSNASEDDIQTRDIRGGDPNHLLVYFKAPVTPTTFDGTSVSPSEEHSLAGWRAELARLYKIPATPGYHLARVSSDYQSYNQRSKDCESVADAESCLQEVFDSVPQPVERFVENQADVADPVVIELGPTFKLPPTQ